MAGIYKIGFPDGTAEDDAKEQAIATVREDDGDDVTAGPDVIPQGDGSLIVRIVTGIEDPLIARPRGAEPEPLAPDPAHQALARMADLPPDKVAQLNQILDLLEAK